jgi:hypothetical protein
LPFSFLLFSKFNIFYQSYNLNSKRFSGVNKYVISFNRFLNSPGFSYFYEPVF